ncbi:E1-E2 ATPase-domain-containing protein [Blyttiomyces helicus]|uniref:E1-E2 ATPase-domain-containing protein n=1 Tax=Blyttiomyces helicus TaxID=388810 RepID=A0A4P9W771_9FUNG|nr:E1-E2 ATPase-domain-containing protein [Blyttiomyces helicus]|eukprot:RKO88309.1 E1-E2 ATPase-domain-containing protein [Blyttiomyces helicus]
MSGLLQNLSHSTGNLLSRRPTEDAVLALLLFGQFLEEVTEFRAAVCTRSASDLRHSLYIHRYCTGGAGPEERETAAGVLALIVRWVPQVEDWRDLVAEEHDKVEKVVSEFSSKFEQPGMPLVKDLLPPPALYFDKNPERLAEMFSTSITSGLASSRVADLTDHYGLNALPEPPKSSSLHMLFTQVTDFMILILIAAAIAEGAAGDIKSTIVLLAVVVLNVVIGFTQEYKANKALEALLSLSVPQATVIRDGKQESISSVLLVPGDIVVLEEGDLIPADLRLCEVAQLEIVEVILTGEAVGVAKSVRTIRKRTRRLPLGDCKGNAFMATVVARGRGKGIVVRTGSNTEVRKCALTQKRKRIPP